MNLRKSILTALLLAVISIFLSGCCSGGECPFRKLFGSKPCPCDTTTPAPTADAGTQ